MKTCATCLEMLALERFSPRSRSSCTSCQNAKYRAGKTASALRVAHATKRQIMEHYGNGRCACCGVTELIWLTIDHLNDDGAERRRQEDEGGRRFYAWIKRNGFPDGYQVLCFNCNWAKSRGGCPHGGTT